MPACTLGCSRTPGGHGWGRSYSKVLLDALHTACVPAGPSWIAPCRPQVAYLYSYVGMGVAEITCVSGCECEPVEVDAHNDEREISVTQVRGLVKWIGLVK